MSNTLGCGIKDKTLKYDSIMVKCFNCFIFSDIYMISAGVGTPVIEKDGCFFKITGDNTLTPATLDGKIII